MASKPVAMRRWLLTAMAVTLITVILIGLQLSQSQNNVSITATKQANATDLINSATAAVADIMNWCATNVIVECFGNGTCPRISFGECRDHYTWRQELQNDWTATAQAKQTRTVSP